MKKYALLIVFSSIVAVGFGQTKSKPKQKEAAPTQKEMADMMAEMQGAMDEMSPEEKRAMDSMGITMPDMKAIQKSISGVSDAQLKKAYEDDTRIVPVKDASRIASISKTPLTKASLSGFITTAHGKVITQLKPASKTKGEEIYNLIKVQYDSDVATGNTAAGLWMLGKAELALYVMGKACIDNPTNTDNLNNYASMLSMSGAEQLSIPLLAYVNKRFPKNSTILNNLGQAWFGLGEIDKANHYLDSAIRLYAYHPQANYTKSFIEESKNNKAAAVESAKRSIKKAFTENKQNRLRKLDYKLKGDDVNWNRPMPADVLGLEKFNWPNYPLDIETSERLEKDWNAYKKTLEEELEVLNAKLEDLEAAWGVASKKHHQQLLDAGKKGLWVDPVPPLAPIAVVKLKYLVDGKDGQLAFSHQKKLDAINKAGQETENFERKLTTRMEEIREVYKDRFGEGKENPFEQACADQNGAINKFLSSSNTALEQAFTDYLKFLRKKINDEVYYQQYTMWPEEFEVAKVKAKITWLSSIHAQKIMFKNGSDYCQAVHIDEKKVKMKLAAFDDVSCKYHSELKTPVGTIKTDCSRMTTELDLKFIKLGLKQDMDKETFGDQFMSCTVEVGAGASEGINVGPLKAEASIGGSLRVEFDRSGISDVFVKTQAGVSVGTGIVDDGDMAGVGVTDLSVDVGVKGQISLISGKSSVESTGLLEGVFVK